MTDFRIEPGTQADWDGKLVEVLDVQSLEIVTVRNLATGKSSEAPIVDLSPARAKPAASASAQSMEDITTRDLEALAKSAHIRDAVASLCAEERLTAHAVKAKAKELGCSTRKLYRAMERHRIDPGLETHLPKPPGVKPGARLLDHRVEQIIAEAIKDVWLTDQKPNKSDVHREAEKRCVGAGLSKPSLASVQRRIDDTDPRTSTSSREGKKAARDKHGPAAAPLQVDRVFDLLQVDHALLDIVLVDRKHRLPVGRPWLTLAIDCCTRVIAGLHLGFEPPSSIAIAACVSNAWLPKDACLKVAGSDAKWPIWGQWKTIHLDNAREFHGQALRAGCHVNQIIIEYRPVATPHFGGHIERLIGTLSRKIRLLPGATFSSVAERGEYPSEDRAVLTLPELLRWLLLEVDRYHHQPHRGLDGQTPLQVWQKSLSADGCLRLPPIVADAKRLILDFLPFELRRICRDGVSLFGTRYWSPALSPYAGSGKRFTVKYDPRDISKIYVLTPDHGYIETPYADLRRPAISLAEHRFSTRQQKLLNHDPRDEAVRFAAIDQQRAIESEAAAKSKRARRSSERRSIGLKQVADLHATATAVVAVNVEPQADYVTPTQIPFVEEWT